MEKNQICKQSIIVILVPTWVYYRFYLLNILNQHRQTFQSQEQSQELSHNEKEKYEYLINEIKCRHIKLQKQITRRLFNQKNILLKQEINQQIYQQNIKKTHHLQYEYEQNYVIIHNQQLYEIQTYKKQNQLYYTQSLFLQSEQWFRQLQLILLKEEEIPDVYYIDELILQDFQIQEYNQINRYSSLIQLQKTQLQPTQQKMQPHWKVYQKYQKKLTQMITRRQKSRSLKQLEKIQFRTHELWIKYQS